MGHVRSFFNMVTASLMAAGLGEVSSVFNQKTIVSLRVAETVESKLALINWLLPLAHADIGRLQICVRRMRFKVKETDQHFITIERSPAQSADDIGAGALITAGGSKQLGVVEIPSGLYRRIELDLDSSCSNRRAIELTNYRGTFHTDKSATLRFRGDFWIRGSATEVTLSAQPLLEAMENYDGREELSMAVTKSNEVM